MLVMRKLNGAKILKAGYFMQRVFTALTGLIIDNVPRILRPLLSQAPCLAWSNALVLRKTFLDRKVHLYFQTSLWGRVLGQEIKYV